MVMMKWEEKLRAWSVKHILWLGYAAVLVLGLFIRYTYLPLMVADMEFLNAPWFDAIKANGMAGVLDPALQFNYSPMQLYLWALSAPILGNLDTITALKLVSLVMEAALCLVCFLLLRELLPQNRRRLGSFIGFTLLWLHPVLLWNVAGWGQTDTCFALFSLLAVLLLVRGQNIGALAMLGVSLSFKLQALFLLPLFIFWYFCGKKKFSMLWFLLVPGILLLSSLPMAFLGESPFYAINTYLGQTELYSQITYNYPNLYAVMGDAIGGKQMINGMFSRTGMVLCIAALGGMALWLIEKKTELSGRITLLLGAWCVLCCTFFLPRMHERYGIVSEMLLLCWAVCLGKPRAFLYVLLGLLPTMSAYAEYMFRHPFFPLQLGGAMNMALLGLLTWEVVRATAISTAIEVKAS